jgi:hypothetical protein
MEEGIKTARDNMKMCFFCSPGEYSDVEINLHQRDALHQTKYSTFQTAWSQKQGEIQKTVERWNKLLGLGKS